jgi:hypothetical protein
MTEAERLHVEAESCRRLAQQSQTSDVREVLRKMAAEYLERARALEQGADSGSQKAQARPPQPSQQQQQIQPAKEAE